MSSEISFHVVQGLSSNSPSKAGDDKKESMGLPVVPRVPAENGKVLPTSGNDVEKVVVAGSSPATANNKASAQSQRDTMSKAVKDIEDMIQTSRREIRFEVREETGTSVIRVLDKETQKVIRQFPPEEIIALAERFANKSPGLLFETKA